MNTKYKDLASKKGRGQLVELWEIYVPRLFLEFGREGANIVHFKFRRKIKHSFVFLSFKC